MLDSIKAAGARVGMVTGLAGTLVMLGFVTAGANAAGEDPALDAITGLGTKVSLYGAAIVAVVAVSIAIALGVKYLKRAKGAA